MNALKTEAPVTTKIRRVLGVACGLVCIVTLLALFVLGDLNHQRFLVAEYRSPRHELGKDLPADIKGADIYVDQAELERIRLERWILPLVFVVAGAGVFVLQYDKKRANRSDAAD